MTIGSTITWRQASGRLCTMTVDLIHEQGGERWLFGALKADGGFTAVNSIQVLGVERKER